MFFRFRLYGNFIVYFISYIPVAYPSGSLRLFKFIPDEFVFACPKKTNQKKRHPFALLFLILNQSLRVTQTKPPVSLC